MRFPLISHDNSDAHTLYIVRGSACGIASALSRMYATLPSLSNRTLQTNNHTSGGMIGPLLGGTLITISRAVPVYTSAVIFTLAGFCVLLLREGEGDSLDRTGRGKARVVVH